MILRLALLVLVLAMPAPPAAAAATEAVAAQMNECLRRSEQFMQGTPPPQNSSCECLICIADRAFRARRIADVMDRIAHDPRAAATADPAAARRMFDALYARRRWCRCGCRRSRHS